MKSWNARLFWLVGLLGLILANISYANETSVNGFISLTAGKTSNDNETYIVDSQTGTHYDENFSFKPESIFALQLHSEISKNLSTTAQLVGRGSLDFNTELEWAYMTLGFSQNWSLQAGRLRTQFYKYSSSLDVGYSYHWIRPPAVTYNISILNRFEGLSLNYSNYFNKNWDGSFSASYGSARFDSDFNIGTVEMDFFNMYGLAGEVSNEWLTLNANYLRSDSRVFAVDTINMGPISFDKGDLFVDNTSFSAYSVGVEADQGKYFLISEKAKLIPSETNFNGSDSWYVSVGTRIGDYVPHLTYGELKENDNFKSGEVNDFTSTTVGLKYNYNPQTCFKIEYLSRKDSSIEKRFVPGTAAPRDANLLSMSVDLLF